MRASPTPAAIFACCVALSCAGSGPKAFDAQPVEDFSIERVGGLAELNWNNPGARGFESILVLRYNGSTPDGTPQPDVTYRIDDLIGSGVVVFVGEDSSYTDAPDDCGFYTYQVWAQFKDGGWSEAVSGDVELTEENATPESPAALDGPSDACDPTNTFVFTTDPVAGASLYNWSVPEGAEVLDGQGTNSATIRLTRGGDVEVSAANGCSASAPTRLAVTLGSPPLVNRSTPIAGPAMECPNATNVAFSVPPIPNATSYRWTLPPGATVASGDGTNSIVVNLGTEAGEITVEGENTCGRSAPLSRTLGIASASPAVPGPINGPSITCGGLEAQYTVAAGGDASSFTWTVPPGATLVAGQGTDTLRVAFGGAGGAVSVQANNGCGSSPPVNLDVTVEPGVPGAPGPISGVTSACQQTPGLRYEVTDVPGAESYTWTVPDGTSILSPNGSTSILVNLGDGGGPLRVVANNSCGSSAPSQITLSVAGTLPPTPSVITGPEAVCISVTETYSVAPQIQPLTWTVPADASIISGQGTNSVDVQLGSSSGAVAVVSTAPCGPSVPSSLAVAVSAVAPTLPSPIEGPAAICVDRINNDFSVPDATDAVSYLWTLPAGANIVEGDDTSAIKVDWADQFGNVEVQATNGCGSSGTQSLAVQPWSVASPVASVQPLSDRVQAVYSFEVAPALGATVYEKQFAIAMGPWLSLSEDDSPEATTFVTTPGHYQFRTRAKLPGCSDTSFVVSDPFMALGPWSTRRAARPNNRLRGVVNDGSGLLAVGELRGGNPGFVYSPTGAAWTAASIAPAQSFHGVATSGAQSLAVGLGGSVARSNDGGVTWASESVGAPTDLWGVARLSGTWVAVGAAGTLFTDSGGGWVSQDSGTTSALRAIALSGSGLVTVGDGGTIRVSTDGGQSWNASGSSSSGADLFGITSGSGITVAVGSGGAIVWTGAPFDTGTGWMTSSAGSEALRAVAHSPDVGRFVAVGDLGGIFTSVDGDQWSAAGAPSSVDLFAVTYDTVLQMFTAAGDEGTLLTSGDGLSWNRAQDGSTLREVVAVGTTAIIVGDNGGILRSTDATLWQPQPSPTTVHLYSVDTDGAGTLVAVGDGGVVIRSVDDGISWSQVSAGGAALHRVRYGDGRWVAVGDGGAALTSTAPGTTWSPSTTTTNVNLRGLAFGGGLFSATGFGGGGGELAIHWNGLSATWTNSSGVAATGEIQSVVFDGTAFYATGEDTGGGDNVYTSMDGMNWTGQTVEGGTLLRDVREVNAMLVGLGDSLVHSVDASTWLTQGPISGNPTLRSGALVTGRFVAVGNQGAIVSSP